MARKKRQAPGVEVSVSGPQADRRPLAAFRCEPCSIISLRWTNAKTVRCRRCGASAGRFPLEKVPAAKLRRATVDPTNAIGRKLGV